MTESKKGLVWPEVSDLISFSALFSFLKRKPKYRNTFWLAFSTFYVRKKFFSCQAVLNIELHSGFLFENFMSENFFSSCQAWVWLPQLPLVLGLTKGEHGSGMEILPHTIARPICSVHREAAKDDLICFSNLFSHWPLLFSMRQLWRMGREKGTQAFLVNLQIKVQNKSRNKRTKD